MRFCESASTQMGATPLDTPGHLRHELSAHAILFEVGQRIVGEGIVTYAPHHEHIRAEARGGDGLVRALAATAHGEFIGHQGLTSLGDRVSVGNKVHHAGADNCDFHSIASVLIQGATV